MDKSAAMINAKKLPDYIFKKAVENSFNHIIITDGSGKIIYANEAVEAITGYALNEVIGKTPAVWGHQMPDEFYKEFWHRISVEKKPYAGEIINRRKGGDQYIAKIIVSPIIDSGKLIGYIGTEEDISKQKDIDRMKSDFIAIASHDLRTPLTIIKWFMSMIFEGDYGKVDSHLHQPLKEIEKSALKMIDLVNNLLDVSRIEAGKIKITLSNFEMKTLIDEIITAFQPLTIQKKISIETDGLYEHKVCADREKTREIMTNLVGNALKFTKRGKITIGTNISTKNKGMLEVWVKDTGIGIPKDVKKYLFSKYYRVSPENSSVPQGTGLGLYISKILINKMSGEIWLKKSVVRRGSTFAFTLPLSGTLAAVNARLAVKSEEEKRPLPFNLQKGF